MIFSREPSLVFFILFLSLASCSSPRDVEPTERPKIDVVEQYSTTSTAPDPDIVNISFEIKDRTVDGMTMVFVPDGILDLEGPQTPDGDPFPRSDQNSKPVHSFWIDKFEVTNDQYSQCVNAGVCQPTDYVYDDVFKIGNYPVVAITWQSARVYCQWVGGRLPTEVEWKYAAKGPENLQYPWGNLFDGVKANFCDVNCPYGFRHPKFDDGYTRTAPVGTYPDGSSWIGALDMAGNVREWVTDWYPTSYYTLPSQDGSNLSELDSYRGAWGGNWLNQSSDLRTDSSLIVVREYLSTYIGFRCVVDAER